MSEAITYPTGVPYRTPRPRGTNEGAAFTELLSYTLTDKGVRAVRETLSNQPLKLGYAVRQYFKQKGIEVVGFYRLGRYAIEVGFRYGEKDYWLVKSSAPKIEDWDTESLNDWLYGDLTEVQLPKKLEEINARLNQ
jgi:hypothetical protein